MNQVFHSLFAMKPEVVYVTTARFYPANPCFFHSHNRAKNTRDMTTIPVCTIYIESGESLFSIMEIVRIPKMEKDEYDALIHNRFMARIAFQGDKYPYIAPFLYVFDGKHIYFLSTKYGKKIEFFRKCPYVSVEIDQYTRDLSCFMFVNLQGYLEEVSDSIEKKMVRGMFVELIREQNLSTNILSALGHSPQDPPESICVEERSQVWKLTGVRDLVALKNL